MAQKTTVLTDDGNRDAGFLVSEANGYRSRDKITLAQDAAVYAAGTVLEASGNNQIRWAGVNAITGILYAEVDAIAEAADGVMVARDAEIRKDALVYASGVTAQQQTDSIAELAGLGIIARDSVTNV